MNHAHLTITDQHFSPPPVVDCAREVMGGIDLDPCTSKQVNDWNMKAVQYFTSHGLENLDSLDWDFDRPASVWCNPPGGKTGNQSNLKLWLETLYQLWLDGKVEQFFFLCFNREFIGGTEGIDLSVVPQLHFYNRLKYWSYDPVIEDFREGNYKQVGKGGNYIRRQGESGYWIVLDADGIIQPGRYASKKKAIAATDGNYWIWSNSPSHQSSLLYFPPRNRIQWHEQCSKLERAFSPLKNGRWIIPAQPQL